MSQMAFLSQNILIQYYARLQHEIANFHLKCIDFRLFSDFDDGLYLSYITHYTDTWAKL
jgi:hypothetical protein